ncbi:OTU domain-containing protein 3-like [Haliotis rufescens]|uniref:OTU domain-containing protein 3-like n=1 Tax=Haliotis rufescens TaxID=6454 RepID=UPI001EAF9A99|nr:OTU domain-containing protein 3-like [Haliotis rufescens]XP_046332449.1 OTU domain-containing protein 3-like [Haliotis rufescens]
MPGRIRGGHTYNYSMTKKQKQTTEHDVITAKKREERAVREAYKKERKIESYLADDENFPSFATELAKMGLQLRDIPGDGNCLFRALGDQLEGHCRNHFRHRQDVVRYMAEHRDDFEPFMEDDIPFDTHIQNLKKLGVYAGNDAIVSFARLHQVNIVIHQLDAKHLMITGSANSNARQLHISYHNGDHYSSVRKLNDNTESPANIRIQDESDKVSPPSWMNGYTETHKDGEGYVRAIRGCQAIEDEVVAATKCQDLTMIRETLVDCSYDADAAIAHLMQVMELTDKDHSTSSAEDTDSMSSQRTSTDSGIWSDSGTGLRVFGATSISNSTSSRKGQRVHFRDDSLGGSSGYGSLNSDRGGARPKLIAIPTQPVRLSSRKLKEAKKLEKKMRAEDRHRQRVIGTRTLQPQIVPADPNAFTVVSHTASITRI